MEKYDKASQFSRLIDPKVPYFRAKHQQKNKQRVIGSRVGENFLTESDDEQKTVSKLVQIRFYFYPLISAYSHIQVWGAIFQASFGILSSQPDETFILLFNHIFCV